MAYAGKITKISDQTRIHRLIGRLCNAKLDVFIRSSEDSNVVIKGIATTFKEPNEHSKDTFIIVSDLSDKALEYLDGKKTVRVEFAMTSTRILFTSGVIRQRDKSLKIVTPDLLVNVERREAARFLTTPEATAFIRFKNLEGNYKQYLTAPYLAHYKSICDLIPLCDIGVKGIAIKTPFPFYFDILKKGFVDEQAEFVIPMQAPIACKIIIRWSKKLKEYEDQNDTDNFHKVYRFGIEILDPSDEFKKAINLIISQIMKANAI